MHTLIFDGQGFNQLQASLLKDVQPLIIQTYLPVDPKHVFNPESTSIDLGEISRRL